MAYVSIPKDLSHIKSKVIFGLTMRQLICFGSGAVVGLPVFFLCRSPLGTSTAAIAMVITMVPFFLFGLYERYGQPLEKILGNMIRVLFLRPKNRTYRTKNYYSALDRLYHLNKEVDAIVQRSQKLAAKTNVKPKKR